MGYLNMDTASSMDDAIMFTSIAATDVHDAIMRLKTMDASVSSDNNKNVTPPPLLPRPSSNEPMDPPLTKSQATRRVVPSWEQLKHVQTRIDTGLERIVRPSTGKSSKATETEADNEKSQARTEPPPPIEFLRKVIHREPTLVNDKTAYVTAVDCDDALRLIMVDMACGISIGYFDTDEKTRNQLHAKMNLIVRLFELYGYKLSLQTQRQYPDGASKMRWSVAVLSLNQCQC